MHGEGETGVDSFDFSASGASLEQALVSVSSNCVFWAFQLSLKGALLRGSSAKHEKEKTGKDNLDRICGVYRMGSKDRWKSALCGDPDARHWDEWDPWRDKNELACFSLSGVPIASSDPVIPNMKHLRDLSVSWSETSVQNSFPFSPCRI